MEATEQYLAVVLFIMLLSLWMKSYSVTIQMKATEQFLPVVLFIVIQCGSNFCGRNCNKSKNFSFLKINFSVYFCNTNATRYVDFLLYYTIRSATCACKSTGRNCKQSLYVR